MTTIAPYHDKDEWLLARQSGFGGSDAATIAGVNPYKTPMELYLEKTTELAQEEPTWRMRWGNIAEEIAADLYSEITGRKLRRQPLQRHPEYDFLIANVDRQILAGSGGVTETACAEIKCPGINMYYKYKSHGLPSHIVLQLQHYLGCLKYSWGSFVIFNDDDGPPIHFDMEADQEIIDQLFGREIKFWNEHIVPRIPPDVIEVVPMDVPEIDGEMTIVDSEEWWNAARELQEATSLKKTAMELENIAKETVKDLMHRQEIHAAEVLDFARFYYKQYPGRTSWKKTAENLAKEAELDIETFKSVGESYTRFNSYFMK